MIDVKQYIESGILEDYLSGNVTEQERREVGCLSKIYPEIQTELDQLAIALESFAMAQAVKPPVDLKSKIMAQLEFAEEQEQASADETPIIPLNSQKTNTQWGWLAAASVAGLIGFAVYSNGRLERLNSTIDQQTAQIKEQQDLLYSLNNVDNKFVMLKGLEKSPNSMVRVLWNDKTKEVSINVLALPQPTSDKQYQLWAIVGGKPVDLGVFDVNTSVQKMKTVPQADAFAVTLEKRGGSPTPTLTDLFVMGKVT